MKLEPIPIAGAFLVVPEPHRDERGSFARLYCREEFRRLGLNPEVAQVNAGISPQAGTLRGLHFQTGEHAEAKLVSCTRGAVWDVVVDLRPGNGYRTWYGVKLTPEFETMLYIPEGCAHGYLTLMDHTEIRYQTSVPYAPGAAAGVRFDDPSLGIAWPGEIRLVSAQDRAWPLLGAK